MKQYAVLLALTTGILGCRASAPAERPLVARPTTDETLVQVATLVENASMAIDSIWPGFWRPAPAYSLFPYDGGVLIVGDATWLAGLLSGSVVPITRLPPGRTAYVSHGNRAASKPLPSFDLAYPVNGKGIVAVSIIDRHGAMLTALQATTMFLLHESFHHFQQRRWVKLPSIAAGIFAGADTGTSIPLSPAAEDTTRSAERRLLRQAITAPTQSASAASFCRYRGIQLQRLAAAPLGQHVGEAYVEWTEGVATYVGYAATLRILPQGSPTLQAVISSELIKPDAADFSRTHDNWHLYATGAAKSYLAGAFVPDWRDRLAHGETLDEILEAGAFHCERR